jgi:hypothetical protein
LYDKSALVVRPRGRNWSSHLLGVIAPYHDRIAYLYYPLQNGNSIRLIYLESGRGRTPVKAPLTNYQIRDYCSYNALSYP